MPLADSLTPNSLLLFLVFLFVLNLGYGFEPFTDWLYGPRDVMGRKRILVLFQEYARDGDTEFSKKLLQHPHKRPMADMFPLG